VLWIGTQTGLDKIFLKNEQYVVGNISKTNNFFQAIWKIIPKKDSTIWALTNEGTILQAATNRPIAFSSPPSLLLTSIKVNGQSVTEHFSNFSYKQNNLTFNVAAPSFIDEESILYSYVLKGSGNDQRSEPSNNSVFNFVNLLPGRYTLQIRSDFPELMYPSQDFFYTFTIQSPWWQTWWFRTGMGVLLISVVAGGIRFYYRRKLEKQKTILEKQQAIEQERTRIAADMHDDLGAGLTKIKYITENILEKTDAGETTKPELEKLKTFSSALVESMGEIIWAVSEKNNLLSNTLYYLRSYAINYCEENDLECSFEIPESFSDRIVSGNIRRNIFLLLKESLHNIVKHSGAKNITISAAVTEELKLVIKDDGKGFSNNGDTKGNGLINMKKRVMELKGSIFFENNNGTNVIIHLPFTTNQSTIA
jgi:signal transduction histidine kinase